MQTLIEDFAAGGTVAVYTTLFLVAVSTLYEQMRKAGLPHSLAVYINRKVIHAFAAGIVTLLVPLYFHSPWIPLAFSTSLAALLYAARRRGGMRWFQLREDANEVSFVAAWGASLTATWVATGSPLLAIIPPLYISFGDAITGFVRAVIVKRREKHWIGNLAMACFTVPVGVALLGPIWGLATGVVAALAERIDKPVDDNIAVAAVSTLMVIASRLLG